MVKTQKVLLVLEILLGVVLLFSPLVFFKQHGSCGNAWPNPVDITIHGGFIAGKRYFDIIMFPANFQLVTVIICIGMVALTLRKKLRQGLKISLQIVSLLLLLYFPLWMEDYIDIIYGNSDGCNLTTHYQWGYYLYYVILLVHSITTLYSIWPVFKSKAA